jgi:hypothetical protein
MDPMGSIFDAAADASTAFQRYRYCCQMLFQWLEPLLLDTIVDEWLLLFKLLVSKKVIEIDFLCFAVREAPL